MDTDGEDSHFELSTSVCASVRNLSGKHSMRLIQYDICQIDLAKAKGATERRGDDEDVRGDRFKKRKSYEFTRRTKRDIKGSKRGITLF